MLEGIVNHPVIAEVEARLADNPSDPFLQRQMRDVYLAVGDNLGGEPAQSVNYWKKALGFPFGNDEVPLAVRVLFQISFADAACGAIEEANAAFSKAWEMKAAIPPFTQTPFADAMGKMRTLQISPSGWKCISALLSSFAGQIPLALDRGDHAEIAYRKLIVRSLSRKEETWTPVDIQLHIDLGIRLIGSGQIAEGMQQLQTALYVQEKVDYSAYQALLASIFQFLDTVSSPRLQLREQLVWVHFNDSLKSGAFC